MVRWLAPLVLVAATLFDTLANREAAEAGLATWWVFGLLLIAALLVQQRFPATALGLATAGAFAHLAVFGAPLRALDLAVPVTLYTLASRARARWIALAGLGTVLACTFVWILLSQALLALPAGGASRLTLPIETRSAPFLASLSALFPALAILVAAYALGDAARTRRAHLVTLEERAADLQRERRQRESLAAAAERARLSREMHDVVAHGLSVIVMQAQGGAALLRQEPDRAAEALAHIIVTGRVAMADMRSLLGLAQKGAQSGPQLAPQPGVADLPALVDRIRAAGARVVLHIEGEPLTLPTAIDLSAYRIAQEGLTNVLKHAGAGAQATVRLAFSPDRVELEITDDGRGPDKEFEAGHGLRGMAERVAALGGEMSRGAGDSGGFRVRVALPSRPMTEAS